MSILKQQQKNAYQNIEVTQDLEIYSKVSKYNILLVCEKQVERITFLTYSTKIDNKS